MDLFSLKPLLFLLSVLGCCVGQGILPPGPLDAILGRNVTFPTLLTNPVYDFIVWNFNNGEDQVNVATLSQSGLRVAKPYEGRVAVNKTNGGLMLSSVKLEDSGDYSISILSNDRETETEDLKLRVLKPVSDVVITSNLPEAIEYNSTVVLNCSAKGSFLKFSWTNGTTAIVADGNRLTLKSDDASSTLTITGVLRTDLVGPIVCTAANNLQSYSSAPFNLTVYYGPDAVSISPTNVPPFIRSDSDYNLSCSAVSSSPPATLIWYHSQQKMEGIGAVLTLKAIKDLGLGMQVENYTCTATNAKTLRVISSPTVSFAVMDPISGAVISGPSTTLIAGNSTANLSCQAAVGSVSKRVWLKQDKPLTASARLVFSNDSSSLVINPVQKEDFGEYKCELENAVSRDKALYKLLVNFGPEEAKVTGKNKVEVNQPVTFSCSAESVPPANFTWRFNGTVTDVKTPQYVINLAAAANSGIYTCEAYNNVTGKTTTGTITLSVYDKGTMPPDGLSDGAIAGIAIAILVAVGVALALTLYCRQKVPVESPY
ncbi:Carcinoembryonic antigen-related cell adhesion molecule 20 Precursor [Channa argus]|uniref:Carcinoembryonic antigen-related cell adhesion molecule 20 n=1 Tax=Channa argus TaxID=215402 RepID=A0A6G1QWP9_CHAAH|nr:Carcinoembryonic antigen-related cell adhesion molecule 20 Precursor [Channa argus]